jgi:hypothetical protein
MLYVFSTCHNTIRTIPTLTHDPDKPEDLDTGLDDHCADMCMSRSWVRTPHEEEYVGENPQWGGIVIYKDDLLAEAGILA